MWPSIESAYGWVERVADVLSNTLGQTGDRVRQRLAGVVAALCVHLRRTRSPHRGALAHFLLETRRYWSGLFYTYDVEGLPRTNNDLEHLFGSARYHERRASGRRRGSEGLVVRGQVRIIAATATRLSPVQGADLAPKSLAAWRQLRTTLHERRHARVLGRRFRQDPAAYLHALEETLRSALPP
jgi:hypothetical protein